MELDKQKKPKSCMARWIPCYSDDDPDEEEEDVEVFIREDRKTCMIYPEDDWKSHWDMLVSCVLIFTCAVTPFRLAFYAEDKG